jgi:hypothetical protein
MKLEIPVQKHVYDFLTSPEMYGAELPVKARKDTLLGKLIIMLATKGPIGLEDYYGNRFIPELPNNLVLLPVETTFPMKVEFINEANLLYIGSVLDNIFEMQVIFFSMGYTARAGSERGAIAKLYERFSIDDDPIKQEALRGICKRYRERVRENQQKWSRQKPSNFAKKTDHFDQKPSRRMKNRPTQIAAS